MIPLTVHFFPGTREALSDLGWKLPIAIFVLMIPARAVLSPYWINRDQELKNAALCEVINAKSRELLETRARLGDCDIRCEVHKAYVYELRVFRGHIRQDRPDSAGGYIEIRSVPSYSTINNNAHVVIEMMFWNEGALPTHIWGPQLELTIGDRQYIGKYLDGVTGCSIKEERFRGYAESLVQHCEPSADLVINDQNPLIRGRKRLCWLHFTVEDLNPISVENVLFQFRVNDGLNGKYELSQRVDIVRTEIHCEER
jgi:hypothetical protein